MTFAKMALLLYLPRAAKLRAPLQLGLPLCSLPAQHTLDAAPCCSPPAGREPRQVAARLPVTNQYLCWVYRTLVPVASSEGWHFHVGRRSSPPADLCWCGTEGPAAEAFGGCVRSYFLLFDGDWGSNPDNAASSLCSRLVSAFSPRSSSLPFHLALL